MSAPAQRPHGAVLGLCQPGAWCWCYIVARVSQFGCYRMDHVQARYRPEAAAIAQEHGLRCRVLGPTTLQFEPLATGRTIGAAVGPRRALKAAK